MSPATSERRRFALACITGGALAILLFVLVLHAGPGGFFRRETFGNFFDLQAEAWLHGRWNVPPHAFYIEGFRHGAKTYTYFGPWPALLRLPLLAVTRSPLGHLTALSMTLAFTTALTGISMLQWRIRELFRPGRPVGRGELALVAAVVFVGGCGTSLLFLASRAWVYPEAILWGAGLALVAYERIIAFMMQPSRTRLIGAGTFTTLAFLSRASVGAGPLIALGLVLAGRMLRSAHRRWSAPREPARPRRGLVDRLAWLGGADDGRAWVIPLLVAVLVPVAVYAYVNASRFGSPFSIPWDHQVLTIINPRHRRILAANGGSYFGLKFVPTTLLQYLRPDALAFDPHFPWITFPHFRPPIIGDVQFDTVDFSTSVVASMPALAVLGGFGVYAALIPRYGRTPGAAWLRVPLIGALGGIGPTIAISFIAQRYLGDFVPLLVIAALIGIQALLRRNEEAKRRVATRVAVVGLVVLALFGVWVNGGLAVLYARLYAPQNDTDRLAMLQLQRDLEIGGPHSVGRSAALPVHHPAPGGTTWVVGDCDAVYWSDGVSWSPIQGTPAGGWFRLLVRARDLAPGWQPLITDGGPGTGVVVGIKGDGTGTPGGTAEVGLGTIGPDGVTTWPTDATRVPFGPGPHRIDALLDGTIRFVRVIVDGTTVVFARDGGAAVPTGPFVVSDAVRQLPPSVGLCHDLVDHTGSS